MALTGLAFLSLLVACHPSDLPFGKEYPSLRSVPAEPRPSVPIEERREIVRDLIEERQTTQRQTAAVRQRSGLSAEFFLESDDLLAEDVIPDGQDGDSQSFRLRPEPSGVTADSVYRSNTEFDDGGLDDFIRQLRRDTQPPSPEDDDLPSGGLTSNPDDDDLSFLAPPPGDHRPQLLLAAIAPVLGTGKVAAPDVMIRLASSEEEQGIICSVLGYFVAWFGICVPPAANEDREASADVEQNSETVDDGAADDSEPPASQEARQERAERRLSEAEASEAIERSGEGVLAPVAGSLERLRDLIRGQTVAGDGRSPSGTSAPRSAAAVPPLDAADIPPIPRERPHRLEDLTIVDQGEVFHFARTPTPAFKPSDETLAMVILPPVDAPAQQRPIAPARTPEPRPDIVPPLPSLPPLDSRPEPDRPTSRVPTAPTDTGTASGRPEIVVGAAPNVQGPDTTEPDVRPTPSARGPLEALVDPIVTEPNAALAPPLTERSDDWGTAVVEGLPDVPAEQQASADTRLVILFGPEMTSLPADVQPKLATLLAEAQLLGERIHIIGEASTNHLARRRATDVGAALVRLGATAEILEYDHEAIAGVDQVRLVLRLAEPDPLFSTDDPIVEER